MTEPTPWIDPELVAVGAWMKARGLAAMSPVTAPLSECRVMLDRIGIALREYSTPLAREQDVAVPGPHGAIPCRLYLPDGMTRPPLLVYAHGGSFALGTLDAWDGMLRDLVRESGVAVLSVDYRLAPEYRFPAGFDDMLSTILYAASDGAAWGVDPTRLAAGGDSAGANLALGAALALRDAKASPLSFLLQIYGVYSTNGESDAWRRLGTGTYGLSQAQMTWIYEHYLTTPSQRNDWRVAPLNADLKGLPPTHSIVGTLDPLVDDNEAFAQRLDAAGVPNKLLRYEGLTHGFIRYGPLVRTAKCAVRECAGALKRGLTR